MTKITATDLKAHGTRAIEDALVEHAEAMISVRRRVRYVVVDVDRYIYLKECEQLAARAAAQADYEASRFVKETASAHLSRLQEKLGKA